MTLFRVDSYILKESSKNCHCEIEDKASASFKMEMTSVYPVIPKRSEE